jgi:hypothetical protein
LLIVSALAATATVIWMHLLEREQLANRPTGCPVSAPQSVVAYATLASNAPVSPGAAEVSVLSATNRRELATHVATSLKILGFVRATPLGKDLLHPPGTMRCIGQIRFGPHGVRAARTLSLVLPCAQLVRDQRQDNSVDLALGNAFANLDPRPSARAALRQLEAPAPNETQAQGAVRPVASSAATNLAAWLLAADHQKTC